MTIEFVVFGGLWFDKRNGNTYFVSKILDLQTGITYYTEYQYGYGKQYYFSAKAYLQERFGYKEFLLWDMGSAHFKKTDLKYHNF